MSAQDAVKIFGSAVAAVQLGTLINSHVVIKDDEMVIGGCSFSLPLKGRLIVIGAGKASAAMAVSVENILKSRISAGLVITKYDHSLPLQIIKCREAGHPVPDANGLAATEELLSLVSNLQDDDIVIFLVSGGASALMADVPNGIKLAEVQQLARLLLASGANIDEINAVRKHLSLVKGGQLSKLVYPAKLISLILSDVNGDPLSVIASGPTVGDPSTFNDALDILNKYSLITALPESILKYLQDGAAGKIAETPNPGAEDFRRTSNMLIGTNAIALDAAANAADTLGYKPVVINTSLDRDAEEQAAIFLEACLQYKGIRPACLLMGGETTVVVKGNGLGGRNQHFALAALCEAVKRNLSKQDMPVILSGGTDGTDGPTDAAGAVIDENSLDNNNDNSREDMFHALVANDSYHYFERYGGLIRTGPTQTNVMDIVIGLLH